jgi:hypothetical protein
MFIANVRAPVLYVVQHGVAYVLRQREHAVSAAFSTDMKTAVLPVDVGMT